MTGVEEYPDLDQLESQIREDFNDTTQKLAEESEENSDIYENLALENIVVIGEWGRGIADKGSNPLEGVLYVDIENKDSLGVPENFGQTDPFQQLRDQFFDEFRITPGGDIQNWFTGANFGMLPVNSYLDSLRAYINRGQPNRIFELTRRAIVTPGPQEPEFEPIGQTAEEVAVEDTAGGDILDYPSLESLRGRLNNAFQIARELEEEDASPAQKDAISNLYVEKYVVVGSWGNGTAVMGEDPLQVIASMNIEGASPQSVTFFDRASSTVADRMEQTLEQNETMQEWFEGVSVTSEPSNYLEKGTEVRLRNLEPPRAVDISDGNIYTLEDGEITREPIALEEPEPTQPEEEEEEEPSELEELREEFPGVPVELLPFVRGSESGPVAEIPAGKETKSVTPREPYPFEKKMFNPRTENGADVIGGIGESIVSQRFGEQDPPATFPRTGVYIRNYLVNIGPSYVLQMYNSLVTYSGYVSSMYDGDFRPGEYASFRKMINNLKRYSESDSGERLIRSISDDEAEYRGMETVPRLPTGEPAPWLESKSYYAIVEENKDHPAWLNITDRVAELEG